MRIDGRGHETALASGMKALWVPARLFAVALACLGAGVAHAEDTDANSAVALRAKYGVLQEQLSRNQFQRPLYMDSSETSGAVTGDIYALINYPFATAGAALNGPARWCDILMLHVNTKYCRASTDSRGSVLQVNIGKKHDQPLDEAYRLHFAYRIAAATPDYLKVMLTADAGPLGTRYSGYSTRPQLTLPRFFPEAPSTLRRVHDTSVSARNCIVCTLANRPYISGGRLLSHR